MNIHPIFVHFPIALLTLYAMVEIAGVIPRVRRLAWTENVKEFLVITGTFMAFVTMQTGEMAQELLEKGGMDPSLQHLIKTHSLFANISSYVFLVLALIYLIRVIRKQTWVGSIPPIIQKVLHWYMKIFNHQEVLLSGAVIGLLSITITGALGGSIVYGPDVDPVAKLVYNLFVK